MFIKVLLIVDCAMSKPFVHLRSSISPGVLPYFLRNAVLILWMSLNTSKGMTEYQNAF